LQGKKTWGGGTGEPTLSEGVAAHLPNRKGEEQTEVSFGAGATRGFPISFLRKKKGKRKIVANRRGGSRRRRGREINRNCEKSSARAVAAQYHIRAMT